MSHTISTVTASSTLDRMQHKKSCWNHYTTQLQTLHWEGVVKDPCIPKGYIPDKNSKNESSRFSVEESRFRASLQAAGNFSKCRSAAFTLLKEGKEKFPYKPCSIGSIYTPNLRGSFLATENFFHTSKVFGLGGKNWLSEMVLAGKRLCGEDWCYALESIH